MTTTVARVVAHHPGYAITTMLVARGLRWYLRSNLRGRTRLTGVLTRHLPPLWSVPIRIHDCPPVYVDLRTDHARYLLHGEPWQRAPREEAEQNVMRQVVRQGDVVFDIGANVGLHSVLLSRLVGREGRLVVFEPNSALLPNLRRTLQGLENTVLFECALSDRAGQAEFFVPADDMKASLADWTDVATDGKAREVTCEQSRLDDLIEAGAVGEPDFIKCDVEGAELLVFRGARRVLDRPDAPVVLFEVNGHTAAGFGFGAMDAKDFLEGLRSPRYQFFKVREDGSLSRLGTSNPWSNVLAVPIAQVARLSGLAVMAEPAG
jgi:FkbM family methyltransferase